MDGDDRAELDESLALGHHEIVAPPFGNWPAFIAFCQAYVISPLCQWRGGAFYPMRFLRKGNPGWVLPDL